MLSVQYSTYIFSTKSTWSMHSTQSLGRNILVQEMYVIRCGEQTSFEDWGERRSRGGKMLSVEVCNDEKTGGGETAPWGTNCVVVASIGGQIHT